jgi:hypothetical protein
VPDRCGPGDHLRVAVAASRSAVAGRDVDQSWSSVEMVARYQHITDVTRHNVAGQVDQVIWQTTSLPDSTGLVTVRRSARGHPADRGHWLGLQRRRGPPDLEEAITPSGPPCRMVPQTVARARSKAAIEAGDPADPYARYRPFSICAAQSTGGG